MPIGTPTLLLPLRHRSFRFLYVGQVVSNLGDWLDGLAVIILVVYQWQEGPTALAALTLAWMVPGAALGPFAGALADRWPKRRTMVVCDLARAVVVLGLIVAPGVSTVVALQVLKSVFSCLFAPSRQSAVQSTVPEADLLAANALGRLSLNATKVLGPALGGLLVAAFGPRPVFALDAATFVVSALCLGQLPGLDRIRSATHSTGTTFWLDLRAGVAFIVGSPLVRAVVLAIMAEMVIVEINDTLTVLAFKGLGMGEALVGLALGASGLGNVLATLLIGQWGGRVRPLTTMGGGMLLVGVVEAAIGAALIAGLTGYASVWLFALVVCGGGFAAIWVPYGYLLQRETPTALMARVSATADGLSTVSGMIGPPLGAALTTPLGLGPVFGGTGVALAILGIGLWLVQPGAAQPPVTAPSEPVPG
jgi:MFS family permease